MTFTLEREPDESVRLLTDGTSITPYLHRVPDGWQWSTSATDPSHGVDDVQDWKSAALDASGELRDITVKVDQPNPPRVEVLTEAASLITGDRNETYGSPTENFSNIAALWNVQIGHKLSAPITAADVAQLMVQVKMARMIAQPKRDNYVDAAGYLACGWECEDAE